MSQLPLFGADDTIEPGTMRRDGWIGHAGQLGRNRVWTHPHYPGIAIHHCGHPTALHPYYLANPDGTVAPPGTFKRLQQAQAYVLTHFMKGPTT